MSFRQFGGLNFAARNNIVGSNYNTSNNLQVTQNVGQSNSYMNFLSDISANNILTHSLICSNNASIYGNLIVSGSTTLTGNVGIGKATSTSYALDISGNSHVGGNQDISGNITLSGNETIRGTLGVTSTSTLSGNVGIGKAPSSYALDILGNSNISGLLNLAIYPIYSGSSFIIPSSNQLITKAYADRAYLSTDLLSNNNAWTGTNTFNTYLPTSTVTPTLSTQLITKAYADSTYVGSSLLSNNNTWTGTNSFSKNVGIGRPSTSNALDISGNCNIVGTLGVTSASTLTGNVGIGKASSAYALDISGNCNVNGNYYQNGFSTGNFYADISNNINYSGVTSTFSDTVSGLGNVGIGNNSLTSVNSGIYNTAIGGQSLYTLTTGSYNNSIGAQSSYSITSGLNNVALGYQSLFSLTDGSNNCAIGFQSARWIGTTSLNNVAIGAQTLKSVEGSNSICNYNVAIGYASLTNVSSCNSNTAVGYYSLFNDISGNYNSSLGFRSGYSYDGSYNTYLGAYTNSSGVFSYSTAIGQNSIITANHQIVLGTSSEIVVIPGSLTANSISFTNLTVSGTSTLTGNVGIGKATSAYALDISGNCNVSGISTALKFNALSDYRIKEDIQPLNETYTIDNLRPVTYKNKITQKQDIGIIAHELQEHYPILVNGEKDATELQSVNYIGLIGILIQEIKELKKEIQEIKELKKS
jgi:hypothetical protein